MNQLLQNQESQATPQRCAHQFEGCGPQRIVRKEGTQGREEGTTHVHRMHTAHRKDTKSEIRTEPTDIHTYSHALTIHTHTAYTHTGTHITIHMPVRNYQRTHALTHTDTHTHTPTDPIFTFSHIQHTSIDTPTSACKQRLKV